MKIISFTVLICAAFITNAVAQVQVLQKAIDRIGSLKSISYNSKRISTNPFSGGIDSSTYTSAFFNRAADGKYASYYIMVDASYGKAKYIYHNQKLVSINWGEKSYRFEPGYTDGSYHASVFAVADNLKDYLKNDKYRLMQMADSMVNKVLCSHLYFVSKDASNKSYTKHHVFISKGDDMLVYSRRALQGEMKKGGMSLGIIKMNDEHYFTNYKFNPKEPGPAAFSIPAGFSKESKVAFIPGLKKGAVAPAWELTSTDGDTLSLEKLKGKVVLIDFTSIACPACMLSVKALKNLHQKYKDTNVEIVTINKSDTREAISKFRKLNNIATPIYADGNEVAKTYKTYGVPNFYIINKQGEVSEYYDGFFENFEAIISARIEEVRK